MQIYTCWYLDIWFIPTPTAQYASNCDNTQTSALKCMYRKQGNASTRGRLLDSWIHRKLSSWQKIIALPLPPFLRNKKKNAFVLS